jgi:hypothetical protein
MAQQQQPQARHLQQQQQQQQEQNAGSSSVTAAQVPEHTMQLLRLASEGLTAGRPAQARQHAAVALKALQLQQQHHQQQQQQARTEAAAGSSSAAASGGGGAIANGSSTSTSSVLQACVKEAQQLDALATVLAETQQHNWLAALQLDTAAVSSTTTTSSNSSGIIQRAYRRIAGLIHPDKCSHPTAAAGFQALTAAAAGALAQAVQGSAGGWPAGFSAEGWGDGALNPDADVDEEYAWWSKWEADVADGCIDGAAAAAGCGGSSSSSSSRSSRGTQAAEEDAAELSRMDLQVCASWGWGWGGGVEVGWGVAVIWNGWERRC